VRAFFFAATLLLALVAASPGHAEERWIESWGTSLPLVSAPPPAFETEREGGAPAERPPLGPPFVPYPASFADQTIRMVVRTSAGGSRFRLEFASVQGGQPVTFGAVHAALAMEGGATVAGSDRIVTFGGREGLTLHSGARAVSDPIDLPLPPLTEVAVSIYLPDETPANTVDALGLMPTYIAQGNRAADRSLDSPTIAGSYFWLRGLSVPVEDPGAGTIVALGDSITEGYATTPGKHRSWPSLLAERLQREPALAGWGVVNAGISGNRVLRPGAGEALVARFSEDVLARPGVKWLIVLASINDINMSIIPGIPADQAATAEQIIAGLDQLVARAHLHGIKVAGGTVMPTKGLPFYSAAGEAMRQSVNDWMRTSGRFDAVIDFDAATRDPADPLRLRPEIDPGDHVHPNDAGNALMADAVDLDIFLPSERAQSR
jgi:lysophospholipase L1-like esterase